MMHRSAYYSLRSGGIRSAPSARRSFSKCSALSLWAGTTHPYENQKVQVPSNGPQPADMTIASPLSKAEQVERLHYEFVEDLLNRAAASVSGLDSSVDTRLKTAKPANKKHSEMESLSEPPLFRTDGPLTPYPISLDSGEVLEPKHATLVRIMDRQGEERSIVVADVEEESGKQRKVLLAVDLNQYQDAGRGTIGRKVSAEEVFATVGLEVPRRQQSKMARLLSYEEMVG